MAKIGQFYLSHRPGPDRQPIHVGGRVVYVRAVSTRFDDLVDALDAMRPQPDEHVMNTHYLMPSLDDGEGR